MASCGGGACGSGCQKPDEDGGAVKEEEDEMRERVEGLSFPRKAASSSGRCTKCAEEGAAAVSNGLCAACFRAYLFGKFKLAVTANAMIAPTDKVLVAFSGGPSSRVALQFVHEMQCKSLKNWDASRSQALPVFTVGVVFIDESMLSLKTSHDMNTEIEVIRSTVSSLYPAHKELHIVPIGNICSEGSADGKSRLNELLDLVADVSGKEDLLKHLRMLSMQKIALDNRYDKLVLGTSASAIACHVISATVKGQGYSLPADVQYVDSRWDIPVVLPLRDCLAEELSTLCSLDGLKMQQPLERPSAGINSLVSSFISRLQAENPSREHTIVRTAGKLKPFHFNKFIDNGYHDFLPSRLRSKFQNINDGESALFEVLCPICGSPLSESELWSLRTVLDKGQSRAQNFSAHCCQSCSFQILPQEADTLTKFCSVLPPLMVDRLKCSTYLRDQIDDCLLDDDDDDDDDET